MTHLLYPFIRQWTFRLLPCLGSCTQSSVCDFAGVSFSQQLVITTASWALMPFAEMCAWEGGSRQGNVRVDQTPLVQHVSVRRAATCPTSWGQGPGRVFLRPPAPRPASSGAHTLRLAEGMMRDHRNKVSEWPAALVQLLFTGVLLAGFQSLPTWTGAAQVHQSVQVGL